MMERIFIILSEINAVLLTGLVTENIINIVWQHQIFPER